MHLYLDQPVIENRICRISRRAAAKKRKLKPSPSPRARARVGSAAVERVASDAASLSCVNMYVKLSFSCLARTSTIRPSRAHARTRARARASPRASRDGSFRTMRLSTRACARMCVCVCVCVCVCGRARDPDRSRGDGGQDTRSKKNNVGDPACNVKRASQSIDETRQRERERERGGGWGWSYLRWRDCSCSANVARACTNRHRSRPIGYRKNVTLRSAWGGRGRAFPARRRWTSEGRPGEPSAKLSPRRGEGRGTRFATPRFSAINYLYPLPFADPRQDRGTSRGEGETNPENRELERGGVRVTRARALISFSREAVSAIGNDAVVA